MYGYLRHSSYQFFFVTERDKEDLDLHTFAFSWSLSRTPGYLFKFPAFYERGENLVTYKGRASKL